MPNVIVTGGSNGIMAAGESVATFGEVAVHNAGTNGAGSAPALTSLGFVSGTAAQLTDLTRDYTVYLECTTTGTATSIAIGPTSTPATTIMASAACSAGTVYTVRLPAGWYLKWAGTTTAFATQTAIGC